MTAIVWHHVTRMYGDLRAIDDVSLTIAQGEIVGLLGPNGAGKSTLLSLAAGLRAPTCGEVRLMGRDPRDPAARRQLGTTPQETGLPPALRAREVVDLTRGHFADPLPTADVLDRFGLSSLARRPTGSLSGGQKRRLALALALVGKPAVVLLDEPTSGLDVDARHALWGTIREHRAAGGTAVITSHNVDEIEALADRVVVLDRGRIVADDGVAAVRSRVASRRVSVRVPSDFSWPEGWLASAPSSAHATFVPVEDGRWGAVVTDPDATVRALVADEVPFIDLEVRGATLEEAFMAMTGITGGERA